MSNTDSKLPKLVPTAKIGEPCPAKTNEKSASAIFRGSGQVQFDFTWGADRNDRLLVALHVKTDLSLLVPTHTAPLLRQRHGRGESG